MSRRPGHRIPRLNARSAAMSRASRLLDEGRDREARTLLEQTLPTKPPAGGAFDRWLIDATALWVQLTDDDPDTYPARLDWARRAYHAGRTLSDKPLDLDLRRDSIDAYASALNRLGHFEEAFAICREGIDLAFARGDIDDALDRRILLAAGQHDWRCGDANHDAITALTQLQDRHPETTITSLTQALPILACLETCHQHEAADTIAARIRLTDLKDLKDTSLLDDILDITEQFAEQYIDHTARVHADVVCDRADCPVQNPTGDTAPAEPQRTMTTRVYELLLAGYNPATAPPHPVLTKVASRYTTVAAPRPHTRSASPLDWARYVHNAHLQDPNQDLALAITTTRDVATTFQRLGHPHEVDQAWQRLADFTDRLDPDDAVTCRMVIAEEHYREGRCDKALATSSAAIAAWQAQQPRTTLRGMVAMIRTDLLFDGCHRHTGHPHNQPIDLSTLDNDDNANLFAMYCHGLTVMARHARTYHPDDPCIDPECRDQLRSAADIPHRHVLRTVSPRYDDGQHAEVTAVTSAHLADIDPDTSPTSQTLAALALLHCDSAAITASTSSDPATVNAVRTSVLAWTRYVLRAVQELDPNRTQWINASRTLSHAASLCGAHAEAIQIAHEVLEHQHATADTAGAITARLDLADALQAAGRCGNAGTEADIAWSDAQRHYDPDIREERFTALLTGINVGAMHGDCHRHQHADTTIEAAIQRYAAPGTDHERQQRWQAANAAIALRRERHASLHPDGSCDNHDAQIATLVQRMFGDRRTSPSA
ncbi:hypothetical protein [Dactylosporangium sp. NPDC006015]|uniref:hypothetical protein n=1 Tax=Dactylosporangium sp. NPDC006015 TaxID=3154576 RepID=UPI0033AC88E6